MFGTCCISLINDRTNIFYQKPKNFENITLLPIIYKSVMKNPNTFSESEKQWAEEKGNSNSNIAANSEPWHI